MAMELSIEARPPVEIDLEIRGEPESWTRVIPPNGGKPYISPATRAATDALAWQLRRAWGRGAVTHSKFVVVLEFHCRTTRRKDWDNMAKLVCDAGNKIIWRDDSQICEANVKVFRGVPRPRTVISIREVLP